jgi:hypothetical protein
MSFIVDPNVEYLDKNIEFVYFYGTFKEKYIGDVHYNILVFATLSKTHKLIPLGFIISFRNRSTEWKSLWTGIVKLYGSFGFEFSYSVLMSDCGPGEGKFIRDHNIKNHFLCWYHVSDIFINHMKQNECHGLEQKIWNFIILIYCAKTREWRDDCVKYFIRFMELNKLEDFYKSILFYLQEDIFNKWNCLKKLSTLRDHSNNYIEVEFGSINKKRSKNTCPIVNVVNSFHERLENIYIDIRKKQKNAKKELASLIHQKGLEHFRLFKFYDVRDGIWNCESSQLNSFYIIDIQKFYCTCPVFNSNGNRKWMKMGNKFGVNLKKLVEGGMYGKIYKHMAAVF